MRRSRLVQAAIGAVVVAAGSVAAVVAGGSANAATGTPLPAHVLAPSSSTVKIWVHGWYGTGTIFADDVTVA